MRTIAITGASGYIGQALVAELVQLGCYRVKILSRRCDSGIRIFPVGVESIKGDLRELRTLRNFFEPGCIAVNLAYQWDGDEASNLAMTRNMLDACEASRVGRLIHCSTAVVAGRSDRNQIIEGVAGVPVTKYAITKLKIEQAILSATGLDRVILRPTAVFGPGGKNLKKLAGDLIGGNRLRNYLKSCLFNKRRMNLVHLANVVAAIRFLGEYKKSFDGEVLIVSDADHLANNFRDVEHILMRELGIPAYRLPRLPLPLGLLRLMLTCLGNDNTNPYSDYSPAKLLELGFERPLSFEVGLVKYATWYRTFLSDEQTHNSIPYARIER